MKWLTSIQMINFYSIVGNRTNRQILNYLDFKYVLCVIHFFAMSQGKHWTLPWSSKFPHSLKLNEVWFIIHADGYVTDSHKFSCILCTNNNVYSVSIMLPLSRIIATFRLSLNYHSVWYDIQIMPWSRLKNKSTL